MIEKRRRLLYLRKYHRLTLVIRNYIPVYSNDYIKTALTFPDSVIYVVSSPTPGGLAGARGQHRFILRSVRGWTQIKNDITSVCSTHIHHKHESEKHHFGRNRTCSWSSILPSLLYRDSREGPHVERLYLIYQLALPNGSLVFLRGIEAHVSPASCTWSGITSTRWVYTLSHSFHEYTTAVIELTAFAYGLQ